MNFDNEYIEVIKFVPSAVYEKNGRTIFEFGGDALFDVEYQGNIFTFMHILNSTRTQIEYINDFAFEDVVLMFEGENADLEISLLDLHNDIVQHADYREIMDRFMKGRNKILDKNFFDKFELAFEEMVDTEGDETMVSPYELDSIILSLETMNKIKYKPSAINVALDTGNKELFMKLTGGNNIES